MSLSNWRLAGLNNQPDTLLFSSEVFKLQTARVFAIAGGGVQAFVCNSLSAVVPV